MGDMLDSPFTPNIVVLLLEDSMLDRDLAEAQLRRSGLRAVIHHAVGRQDFTELLYAREYDLVLADYDVPGFNGLLALDMVRLHNPHLPFIFISGVVGEEVAIDSVHRGATDYVLKQRLDRLGPAVRRALRESLEHATRLRAEAAARSSEARFRQLTNALTQLIWTLDEEGTLTYANPAWHRTIRADIARWCDSQIIHEEDLKNCEAAWEKARQNQAGFSVEARMLHHSTGKYHWYLMRIEPFSTDGGAPAWLCTATDVQEQRVREEALRTAEKLAVTGRMAATIAHEINNPLESLTNLVFLLRQDQALSDSARRYINMADYELQRVSAIAKQTLAFYRDSSEPCTIALRELAEDVLRLFGPRFRAKSIATTLEMDEHCIVFATRGELRQVLVNLISNAIDAAPVGGAIRVMAQRSPGSGPARTVILVEDTGPGISEQHLEQLFTPFFSTKGEHGTGLGLWVSKGIVEKHHGSINITSHAQPDGSNRTQVRITLPCHHLAQVDEQQSDPALRAS